MKFKIIVAVGFIIFSLSTVIFFLFLRSEDQVKLTSATLPVKNATLVSPSPSPIQFSFDRSLSLEEEVDKLIPEDFTNDFKKLREQL